MSFHYDSFCIRIGRFSVFLYAVMCRMLSMYDVTDEDIDSVADLSQPSTAGQAPLEMQLPILELLKVYFLYIYVSFNFL